MSMPMCVVCLCSQIMYHVGSGVNDAAQGLLAYHKEHGVVTQGYSTLGNTPWGHHASADILHGPVTTAIAKKHNVSTVQVSPSGALVQGPHASMHCCPPWQHPKPTLDTWRLPDTRLDFPHASPLQVALKWVIQRGVAAVTKSGNPAHLASDLDLWSWDLDDADMAKLDGHKSADSPSYPSYACSK
jgi:diketogulonate reductase-like aldo/keto reductase